MVTLKEARVSDKIEDFIREREAEAKPEGDADAFNRAVQAMARKSKEAPKSSAARSDDG